jgi:hypothetical protein
VKRVAYVVTAALVALLGAACQEKTVQTATPAAAPAAAPQAAPAMNLGGKVIETMNSGGYTYVLVDTGSEQVWAAAPEFAVQVGDPVIIPDGMPMANYHSKSLDRTFDLVYFVDGILVGGEKMMTMLGEPKMPEGHPPVQVDKTVDLSGIKKAEGGKTVAEVFAGKDQLNGKTVAVRGKVVKFSPEIMGKNWLHLQDGTGAEGTNDLTVTTAGAAKIGDTITVKGTLVANKDFGHGYKYDVIMEDATITAE